MYTQRGGGAAVPGDLHVGRALLSHACGDIPKTSTLDKHLSHAVMNIRHATAERHCVCPICPNLYGYW